MKRTDGGWTDGTDGRMNGRTSDVRLYSSSEGVYGNNCGIDNRDIEGNAAAHSFAGIHDCLAVSVASRHVPLTLRWILNAKLSPPLSNHTEFKGCGRMMLRRSDTHTARMAEISRGEFRNISSRICPARVLGREELYPSQQVGD